MKWFVVFGLAVSFGCSGSKTPDPIAGNYVGWQVIAGTVNEMSGKVGILEKLALKADGTFVYELKSTVMMRLSQDIEGTWTHSGNTVTLTGTQKGYMDDGYKNSPNNGPYSQALTLDSGMLVEISYLGEQYLRKEGTGAPPVKAKGK